MHIGGYELESPLINAGGVIKSPEDTLLLAQTGIGAILAGSFTLDYREGNSPNGETVYYHDSETGITYNSLGMPNKGLRYLVDQDLSEMIEIAHYHNLPFILNLAPISDDPVAEIDEMFSVMAEAGIEELDGFELNAGCPNVVLEDGGRHELLSHYPRQLEAVLERVNDIKRDYFYIGSTIVRISPFVDTRNAISLGMVFNHAEVDVISAFNTFPGGRPLDDEGNEILQVKGGVGGMSGRGMQHEAEMQTMLLDNVRREQNGHYEIIGSNGIHDAESLRRRLRLGASAVSATTMFFESSSWVNTVNGHLNDLTELES